jgi:hypothetical protein
MQAYVTWFFFWSMAADGWISRSDIIPHYFLIALALSHKYFALRQGFLPGKGRLPSFAV